MMNQIILLCTLVTNAWKEPNHVWMDKTYNITRILHTVHLEYDRGGMCKVGKAGDIVPRRYVRQRDDRICLEKSEFTQQTTDHTSLSPQGGSIQQSYQASAAVFKVLNF
jgi:hypothetical protein